MDLAERSCIPMNSAECMALGTEVRGDYIDGEFVLSPSPARPHRDSASNPWRLLRDAAPDGVRVCEAWSWKPGDDEFIPDVRVFDHTE